MGLLLVLTVLLAPEGLITALAGLPRRLFGRRRREPV
jgi:hypothetical protein